MCSGKPNRLVARHSTAGSSGLAGSIGTARTPGIASLGTAVPSSSLRTCPCEASLFEFVPAYRLSPSIACSAVSSPNSTEKGTADRDRAATADRNNGLFRPLASERTLPRLVAGQRNAKRGSPREATSGVDAARSYTPRIRRTAQDIAEAAMSRQRGKGSPPGYERSRWPGNGRMRQTSQSLEDSARFMAVLPRSIDNPRRSSVMPPSTWSQHWRYDVR